MQAEAHVPTPDISGHGSSNIIIIIKHKNLKKTPTRMRRSSAKMQPVAQIPTPVLYCTKYTQRQEGTKPRTSQHRSYGGEKHGKKKH